MCEKESWWAKLVGALLAVGCAGVVSESVSECADGAGGSGRFSP